MSPRNSLGIRLILPVEHFAGENKKLQAIDREDRERFATDLPPPRPFHIQTVKHVRQDEVTRFYEQLRHQHRAHANNVINLREKSQMSDVSRHGEQARAVNRYQ